jgi:hypothetical protein
MAYGWVFKYGVSSTIFTGDVLSFSGSDGRQNYNDNYAGGSFNITIKNNTNQIANFPRGTNVVIFLTTGNPAFEGTVSNIVFNDYPGDKGLSTATITCIDEITRAGKWQLKEFVGYAAGKTITQAKQTNFSFTGLNTPEVLEVGSTGNSDASGVASYSGTILNRLNLLCQTEKGQLSARSGGIYFANRGSISTSPAPVSLTRSTVSTTTIAYEDFKRTAVGDNFYNQVTVTPETVTEQQANNTTSQTSFGVAGYSLTTVDASTTQAAGLASWLANMQGDPTTLRYEVTFTDAGNNSTAFTDLLLGLRVFFDVMLSLQWQAQGQSLQTINTVYEGMSYSGTPSETRITLYLSPNEYYQYFILDDAVNGILDTSRLGW